MKYVILTAAAIAGMALASLAHADQCSDVVRDEAHVISDVSRVERAADSLAAMGMVVRVRTFDNIGADLDRAVLRQRLMCPTWQADANSWKSTMFLLAYAPNNKNQLGAYYGPAVAARFGNGKWQDILRDRFVPQIKPYEAGETGAITAAFTASLSEFQALYARPSTGGNTVIQQASDHSGFAHVLGWFVAALVAFGLIAIGVWFFRNRGRNQAAQAEAKRVRAQCVSGILEITDTDTLALLEAKAAATPLLAGKLSLFRKLGDSALSRFSAFDDIGGFDPNRATLSADAYESNKRAYSDIITACITPARSVREAIEAGRVDESRTFMGGPEPQYPWTRSEAPYVPQFGPGPYPFNRPAPLAPPPPAPTPAPTVVVQQGGDSGFLSGVVIGSILSDHHPEPRFYTEPPPRSNGRYDRDDHGDSGGSFSGSSGSSNSDSGGSFSGDSGGSSSDSGGSSSSC